MGVEGLEKSIPGLLCLDISTSKSISERFSNANFLSKYSEQLKLKYSTFKPFLYLVSHTSISSSKHIPWVNNNISAK